jgi:hypothetical protein
MPEHINRLADQVHEAICGHVDEFLRAEGMAVLTVLRHGDNAEIALDSKKVLVGVGGPHRVVPTQRLPGDVRQLADDVRRALLAEHVLASRARQITIEIHLLGPRPSFDLSYRPRRS